MKGGNMTEFDIRMVDAQANCIACGSKKKGSGFYCGRHGHYALLESEREGME